MSTEQAGQAKSVKRSYVRVQRTRKERRENRLAGIAARKAAGYPALVRRPSL